jgi:3-hydroxyacyl-CoA dehydrogenase
MGILRRGDEIVMNRERLLASAKARALAMAADYRPPEPPVFTLPGPSGRVALTMAAEGFHRQGLATGHDLVVAAALADILSGGDADPTIPLEEEAVLALERDAFMRLVRTEPTLARIAHTLETGKPLRN